MARFEVRLPDEELERWRLAAQAAGWSIATLVKRSVAALLAVQRLPDGGVQGPQPFLAGSAVVAEARSSLGLEPLVPEQTAASEAAAAAATLPDPAEPARSRVPAAETVCVHRVKAPAYCKQCGKQVGT